MIYFALPGLYEHFGVNQALINLKQSNPEFFLEWDFGAIYGNFQFCIWDGGRVFGDYTQASYAQVNFVKDFLNNNNIPLRMIFTNPIITEEYYYDHFCNLITQICEDPLNELVVNSEGLENYLRTNYPKYSFISSTTKCKSNPEDSFKEFNKAYKYVCLDYNLNRNEKYLQSFPAELKPKVELLVNAICPPGCPNRAKHYIANGLSVLNYGIDYSIDCKITNGTLHPSVFAYKNNLYPEELYGHYSQDLGITFFKLEGRTFGDLDVILNYARYLVKPEYQYEFISQMFEISQQFNKEFNKLKELT